MNEWEENISHDGRIYYFNSKTGETDWESPDIKKIPIEKSWRTVKDDLGNIYYYNYKTQESKWKKPLTFDEEIEKNEKIRKERNNFFKMLSSANPTELDPLIQRTPDIFTMKDLSYRFDTDPRMVETPSKHRERYLDEWLILERKRRVNLEKEKILEIKEKIKERLNEMIKTNLINYNTKWDDIIILLKLDNNWKNLLNYDRLNVFKEIMNNLYENQEKILKENYENYLKFENNKKINIKNNLKEFLLKDYNNFINQNFQFYKEILKNNFSNFLINFNLYLNLFYEIQNEITNNLIEISKNLNLNFEDLNFLNFINKFKNLKNNFNEFEIQFIFDYNFYFYLNNNNKINNNNLEKKKKLLKLLKNLPLLYNCNNYEIAKSLLNKNNEFLNIELEEEKILIFKNFCEWNSNRNCEIGEILPDDSDWEDISQYL